MKYVCSTFWALLLSVASAGQGIVDDGGNFFQMDANRETEVRRAIRKELKLFREDEKSRRFLEKRDGYSPAFFQLSWAEMKRWVETESATDAERAYVEEIENRARREMGNMFQQARASAARPSSGGTITKNGRVVVVPGSSVVTKSTRPSAPSGCIWLFPPESPLSGQFMLVAEFERIVDLPDAEWTKSAMESHKRVLERFPFLAKESDSRYRIFDEHLKRVTLDYRYKNILSLPFWRELIVAECAASNSWESPSASTQLPPVSK